MRTNQPPYGVAALIAWLGVLCLTGVAARAESSVVLTFTDVAGKKFSASLTNVEATCPDPEKKHVRLEVDLREFEEVPTESTASETDGGKQGWDLSDLVGDLLRSGGTLVFQLQLDSGAEEDAGVVKKKGRPANTPLLRHGKGSIRFNRTALGLGGQYRQDDPLSLEREITATIKTQCP